MRSVLILLLTCLILIPSFSQSNFTFNRGGTSQSNYFASIPYENIRGKIIVEATISGEKFRFIVDTGAPTIITRRLYSRLNSLVLKRMPIIDQSGKTDSMNVINLAEVVLGGVTFSNIPTLVTDQSEIFTCFGVDGFIGSNLLRNSIISFDNVRKIITLTDSETRLSLDRKKSISLFVNQMQSSPFIWVTLKGVKKKVREQLLFDSGMDGLYDLSLRHYALFKKKKIFEVISRSTGSNSIGAHGTADDTTQYKLRVATFAINGIAMQNVSLQTTPASNSRIGSTLLELGSVTLDYKNRRFYFEPFSNKPIDLYQKGFPVEPVYRDNQLQIGIIWEEALRDKIKTGDQILSVDDTNYETFDLCTLITKVPAFKTKDKITVTTRSKTGAVQQFVLEKK
jgi:predicted aspartyl protease